MKQKIEWYQEVLDLEPGSKVFFPLARMQAEDGQPEAALLTLRHGLARNPEHIEARLLLIDVLYRQGKMDNVWPEVDEIASMLGGYAGFWSAWTQRMARNPQFKDAALALNFLSTTLRGENVSWSDVIEHGLNQLLSHMPATAAPLPALSVPRVESPAPRRFKQEEIEGEEEDEHFTLKTRSMAEVLAEQGDYVGALDIYEELLHAAGSEDEKLIFENAIARLSADIGAAASSTLPMAAAEEKKAPLRGGGTGRLVDMLERLAERLEAKS